MVTGSSIEHEESGLERAMDALRKIAELDKATQVRGLLEDTGVPDKFVDEGGWVPIHPQMKRGLEYAARIARKALETLC